MAVLHGFQQTGEADLLGVMIWSTENYVVPAVDAQSYSEFIVVDQFGNLPDAPKIAVIRNPQTGYDSSESFAPGTTYSLVDSETGSVVLSAAPEAWYGGSIDASSGDQVWHFDFSLVAQFRKKKQPVRR